MFAGDPKAFIESLVACRRAVVGLLKTGEERPKLLEFCPWETDAFRPFAPPCAVTSLFGFCGGGFSGELTSLARVWRQLAN